MQAVENPKKIFTQIKRIPLLGWILFLFGLANIAVGFALVAYSAVFLTRLYSITTFVCFVVIVLALNLYLKGKKDSATLLIIVGTGLYGLITALIIDQAGLPMQLFILVVSGIITLEWTSSLRMMRVMPGIFFVSLATVIVDIFQPAWRIEGIYNPSIVILLVLIIFVVYVAFNFYKYSFQVKMIMLFLGLASISIIGISAATYILAQNTLLEESRFTLKSAALGVGKTIDTFIKNNKKSIQEDAAHPEFPAYLLLASTERPGSDFEKDVVDLLYRFTRRNPFFIESYALIDRNGIDQADTYSDGVWTNQSESDDFIKPFTTGLPYVSAVHISPLTKNSIISFSVPVRSSENEIVGVLRVSYRADILQYYTLQANELGGEGSFGVILDGYNNVLAHGTEPDYIGESFSTYNLPVYMSIEGKLSFPEESKFINNISLGSSESTSLQAVAYMEPITENPWRVLYAEPLQKFQAPLDRQVNIITLIAEGSAILIAVIGSLIARIITTPLASLTKTAEELSKGNLHAKSPITSQDELGLLANTMNIMSAQLMATQTTLEGRIQERTHAIEAAVQVGHLLSTILNTQELAKKVVSELQTTFGYYHVHLYILDKNRNELNMAGGTGEAGEIMLRQGHKIAVGSGLVGRAALTGMVNLVQDTNRETNWLPNPLLPQTQAEIAVPILLGNEVFGVLDVQQNLPDSLTQQDSDLLQLVSSQIAISLRNARLYEETNKNATLQVTIRSIVDKIHSTTTIEEAIKVAAEELSYFTGSRRIEVRMANLKARK